MNKYNRLKDWINTLTIWKKDELLLHCISELIDNETINFYDDMKVPVWDCNGENIDDTYE